MLEEARAPMLLTDTLAHPDQRREEREFGD
jgi:hypothetical protein